MEREVAVMEVEVAQASRGLGNFGVTVSGLQPDTEEGGIGKEQWKAIHENRSWRKATTNP